MELHKRMEKLLQANARSYAKQATSEYQLSLFGWANKRMGAIRKSISRQAKDHARHLRYSTGMSMVDAYRKAKERYPR